MSSANSFARRLWTARQTLFPAFERKGYHLQFRHGALILIMLMALSFTMPAIPQLPDFADSAYTQSATLGVAQSYNKVHKHILGVMWYNCGIAMFIALHLIVEPFFQRGAPVWFEITWMALFAIGEAVCLGLMAASRPDVCRFKFGIEDARMPNNNLTPKNSSTSICSNWRGFTAICAAVLGFLLMHITWHLIVSIRHINSRRSVFALPITDYRWKLPRELERIHDTFPGDIEAPASPVKEGKQPEMSNYTSNDLSLKATSDMTSATETISFPVTGAAGTYSNYDRPVPAKLTLDALPARTQPVVLEQSTMTHSDSSSYAESERSRSLSSPTKPDALAPFSTHRI